jgi:hypothetical protein
MFAFRLGIRHWHPAGPNIHKSKRLDDLGIHVMHSVWILRCQELAYEARSRIQRPRPKHCDAFAHPSSPPWVTRLASNLLESSWLTSHARPRGNVPEARRSCHCLPCSSSTFGEARCHRLCGPFWPLPPHPIPLFPSTQRTLTPSLPPLTHSL